MTSDLHDKIAYFARAHGHVWLNVVMETHGVCRIAGLLEPAARAILRREAARLRERAAALASEARAMRIEARELAAMAA